MYVAAAIVIGFLSAVLAGMFGIGGAALTTPSLRIFLDASPAIALGTTLPVTIPTAAAAAITYWRRGLVDLKVAGTCCLSGVVAATGGAILTKYIDLHYLMIATGAIILYVSAITIRRGLTTEYTPVDVDEGPVTEHTVKLDSASEPLEDAVPVVRALLVGFAAGLLSGLLGVGGGVLLIPGFLYVLHLPIRRAFGTSLAVIVVIAIPGTIVHSLLHHISWTLVLFMVIGSIPGAYLGARLNMKTAERLLYMLFGALLGAFGLLFIVNEIINIVR